MLYLQYPHPVLCQRSITAHSYHLPHHSHSVAYIITDPLVFGDYPSIMRKNAGQRLPTFSDAEQSMLRGSIDYLCINHYTSRYVSAKATKLTRKQLQYVHKQQQTQSKPSWYSDVDVNTNIYDSDGKA